MRVVFINSIFPNAVEPNKGSFILKNLQHYPLDIDLEVIAPVPPFLAWRRRKQAVIPLWRFEEHNGRRYRVWHPRFILLPRNILRSNVPLFEYLSILPLLWLLHRQRKIDCLHANFGLPDGIATRMLSEKLGIPYLITEHQGVIADLLAEPSLKNMLVPAYNHAHRVIAVSDSTANSLSQSGVSRDKVSVIPNGINPELFRHSERAGLMRRLLFVGNLVENKGVQILLQTLALLNDTDLYLSIVGDGVFRPELERLTSTLGLDDQVSFIGEVAPAKLAQLYRQHDALAHPSFIESFGLVVVEAMACGLPVLATRNGGSEHIVTEKTGILVEPRDVNALAEGIRQLRLRSWDSRLISDYAHRHYDIREVVARTIELYPKAEYKGSICHLSSVHIRSDVRVFYKQCVGLAKAGYKVHLVVADGQGDARQLSVLIHDLGLPVGRLQRMLTAPFKVLLKAISLKADIYQIHDPELIPIALLLKLISGKPVIYDIHECYPEMFLHKEYLSVWQGKLISAIIRYVEKLAVSCFDASIAATEHIAEQFRKVPVLHNYPLLSEWQDVPHDPTRFQSRNICYLGSITRERGITQLIEALEHVDCILHLAGSYEPKEYRDELVTLPGFKKVIEYGYINRAQATELLAKCAIGVVFFDRSPNHLHSLSTKMFEYMAAGLPILVSDLPANVNLLDRAGCGKYLDPSKPENIANAIEALLAEPEQLIEMGAKGKSLISSELSWEAEESIYHTLNKALLKLEQE
ncbi:MAG TPA: glycosyltransferase [Candidatus Cloacimonadota bacterium]|nr:glycosyltransferase [Candidatus Cloacimonadota bacterium]HOH60131.1 glycosyltransferase [Candidatus Cloacimonadota bacterium]